MQGQLLVARPEAAVAVAAVVRDLRGAAVV